jgi:hypothetical protein
MQIYSLRFELQPQESIDLIIGKLQLLRDGKQANCYQCSSSLPGRQYPGSWEVKGGLIPPGKFYRVETSPIWMPNIKGVEGSFFAISPFEVSTKGATRGDFGIHFDANIPGSLGCPVLVTQKGWTAFIRDMKLIAAQDIKAISLSVDY